MQQSVCRGGRGNVNRDIYSDFNLWMAYRVLQSKTWRVYVTCLYVLSMVCRIADALVGGGISWR